MPFGYHEFAVRTSLEEQAKGRASESRDIDDVVFDLSWRCCGRLSHTLGRVAEYVLNCSCAQCPSQCAEQSVQPCPPATRSTVRIWLKANR